MTVVEVRAVMLKTYITGNPVRVVRPKLVWLSLRTDANVNKSIVISEQGVATELLVGDLERGRNELASFQWQPTGLILERH